MTKTNLLKLIRCVGTKTDGSTCGADMFHTDGHFVFISGLVINPEANRQRIRCGKCGYVTTWIRDSSRSRGRYRRRI